MKRWWWVGAVALVVALAAVLLVVAPVTWEQFADFVKDYGPGFGGLMAGAMAVLTWVLARRTAEMAKATEEYAGTTAHALLLQVTPHLYIRRHETGHPSHYLHAAGDPPGPVVHLEVVNASEAVAAAVKLYAYIVAMEGDTEQGPLRPWLPWHTALEGKAVEALYDSGLGQPQPGPLDDQRASPFSLSPASAGDAAQLAVDACWVMPVPDAFTAVVVLLTFRDSLGSAHAQLFRLWPTTNVDSKGRGASSQDHVLESVLLAVKGDPPDTR
jgi:hypothetical protein